MLTIFDFRIVKVNETQRILHLQTKSASDIANEMDTHLLTAISYDQYHVLYPMFPSIRLISYSLHPRPHCFSLPNKDDCDFLPRVLYKDILNPFPQLQQ